jgi:hypothetical protein
MRHVAALLRGGWSNATSADLNLVAICCMTSGRGAEGQQPLGEEDSG